MVILTMAFLTMVILTHPVNFPCGKKPERPEKTHEFRQSVDRLFSHESVKGACSDDCVTEVPCVSLQGGRARFLSARIILA
jgi:hypothetical protein